MRRNDNGGVLADVSGGFLCTGPYDERTKASEIHVFAVSKAILDKRKNAENQVISAFFCVLAFSLVTPERFISKGVNSVVYQYVRILENHGCSLLAHPDFSMFFVHLQCKVSNNILIIGYFQC